MMQKQRRIEWNWLKLLLGLSRKIHVSNRLFRSIWFYLTDFSNRYVNRCWVAMNLISETICLPVYSFPVILRGMNFTERDIFWFWFFVFYSVIRIHQLTMTLFLTKSKITTNWWIFKHVMRWFVLLWKKWVVIRLFMVSLLHFS